VWVDRAPLTTALLWVRIHAAPDVFRSDANGVPLQTARCSGAHMLSTPVACRERQIERTFSAVSESIASSTEALLVTVV
jgi:hypothetical protein